MIFILAGSYQQARHCAETSGLKGREWHYVSDRESILGMQRGGAEVWLYGSWRKREDAICLLELFHVKDIPTKHIPEKY